ncbi:unnamed protein product [Auanema sp. JU1783]|nr:unnamed protein product [Auanema sp. JU1783]
MNLVSVPSTYMNLNADYSTCITANLRYCQSAYAAAINSTNAIWEDPQKLNNAVGLLYLDGMDGLLTACKARQQYQYCLGTMYDACMNVPQFINAGQTQDNANLFVQLFKKMEFDCDGGFLQMSQNDRCIGTVWILSANELAACTQKFNNDIAQKVDFCVASAHYEQCTRTYFGTACNQEVSWWQCERTRVGMSLDEYCPQNVCTVLAASKSAQAAAQKPKLDYLQSIFNSYSSS